MIDIEGARLLAMFIRSISVLLAALVAFAVCYGQTKKRSVIQWKPSDCTSPLMLPEGLYDLSQFGKGEYRIDGKVSVGHFNCIYFIFQPSAALNPETVAGATESSRSRNIESARPEAAFLKKCSEVAGTASSER